MSSPYDPTLDWSYVLGGSDEPTYTAPVFSAAAGTIVEPPPGGYPKTIVHPERPNAPFFLLSPGWYRSPTNEVVPYRVVAEYVLSAHGTPREQLLEALGQTAGNKTLLIYAAAGLGIVLILSLLVSR